MQLSEAEKAARKTVRSKLRAGVYSMAPTSHLKSSAQFSDEIGRAIAQQMTAHYGHPPDERSEEFWAFRGLAWETFLPTLHEINEIERAQFRARQDERNRDRPSRWWSHVGGFNAVAIRDDGSLWNPNNYPEADVRAAIAKAETERAERKQKRIRRGVEKRAQRREQRIGQAADVIRKEDGIGCRHDCYCCGKSLTDPVSIARGIGPECWEHVLRAVEWDRSKQAEAAE